MFGLELVINVALVAGITVFTLYDMRFDRVSWSDIGAIAGVGFAMIVLSLGLEFHLGSTSTLDALLEVVLLKQIEMGWARILPVGYGLISVALGLIARRLLCGAGLER